MLLTRRITRRGAVHANAGTPRRTVGLKTITCIGRYKARIAAQTARKTSWAAPEAPSWLRRVEHWLRPPAPSGDPLQLLPWELTSPAALETRGDAARDADLLHLREREPVHVRRAEIHLRRESGTPRARARARAPTRARRATAARLNDARVAAKRRGEREREQRRDAAGRRGAGRARAKTRPRRRRRATRASCA